MDNAIVIVLSKPFIILAALTRFLKSKYIPWNNFHISHIAATPYKISPILKGSQPVKKRKQTAIFG